MVRIALQYTMTRPRDHILEIGFGTPAVLLGYSYYTGINNLTGIDPIPYSMSGDEKFKPAQFELIQGLFPDSQEAMARIKQKAPFSAILALDTLKSRRVLDTEVSPAEFAKVIFELLDNGGSAIIVNDFEEEPYFSKVDVEAAGFSIVRWGELRELADPLKALMPYDPLEPKAGRLKVFVLRKGDPRSDRLRVKKVERES